MTTIHVHGRSLDMPGATTVGYAAMRVAQELGHDPEDPRYIWGLAIKDTVLDTDAIIGDFDGETVELTSYIRSGFKDF